MTHRHFVIWIAALLVGQASAAAELKVVSTVGVQGLLETIRPEFEQRSGEHLQVSYGTSAVLKRELKARSHFDVVILTRALIDELAVQGEVQPGSVTSFVRSGIGIATRIGLPKPRIDTREALRSALLEASGIAYTREGQSGAAAARAFEELGITDRIKEHIVLDARPAGGVLAVADSKATLGIALLSEIAAGERVELVGALPADLQTFVVFAAGVAPGAPSTGRSFIDFLKSAGVDARLPGTGLERP